MKVEEKIRLEDFSEKYIPDVIDIIMDAYQEHPEYGEASRKHAKRYIKWLKKHSTFFKVLTVDDKPVGFVVGDGNWIDMDGKTVGEIHELSLKKDYWGKGLGDYLLKEVLNHFKKTGLKTAALWVGEKNKRAIDFYRKHGFKETGKSIYGWLRMERKL
ncbi:Acetyltransferase (GNAT) family protein [Persephonella hydrogeniphila]|uniref:Acetyltransferase (GNAT) family protein n=1 Tax=Persephonella hydrogeniphila TaxID=198703 RepID=A0A285NNI2_9AQUI|nr:GNAT family N-acetyltransferase [Persephonella hydrogeniphila]SNZ09201.1 Acetyltransferase (GNAT) family protein [Persephonella hydrogeniphila]